MMLPHVGELDDETHGPWIYLAITSKGEGYRKQGLRIVVDTNPRSSAISLGQRHHEIVKQDNNGDHYVSVIEEEWAYSPEEAEYLQWETPQRQTVVDGDVTVVERKFKKK